MKLNWGSSILIFIIFFLTLCTIVIIFSLRQDIDLVTEEYYEAGAEYSKEMEIIKRSKPFFDSINILQENNYLEFKMAPSLASMDTLNIWFYRPSDKDEDYRTLLEIDEAPNLLSIKDLNKGRYILHLTWENEGLNYHLEKNIFIN